MDPGATHCWRTNVAYIVDGVSDATPNGAYVADPNACQAACDTSPTCDFFTFRESGSRPGATPVILPGGCWLLGSDATLKAMHGFIGGPKNCVAMAKSTEAPKVFDVVPPEAKLLNVTRAPPLSAESPEEHPVVHLPPPMTSAAQATASASTTTAPQVKSTKDDRAVMDGFTWLWIVLAFAAAAGLALLIWKFVFKARRGKGASKKPRASSGHERTKRGAELEDTAGDYSKQDDVEEAAPLLAPRELQLVEAPAGQVLQPPEPVMQSQYSLMPPQTLMPGYPAMLPTTAVADGHHALMGQQALIVAPGPPLPMSFAPNGLGIPPPR